MMNRPKPGDPKLDAMTESEFVEFIEQHKDDASNWEAKGRKIRARRGPSTIFQMRITPEELEEIVDVAGGNVSDFVRTAALEKARRMRAAHEPSVTEQLKEQVRRLSETVNRL